MARDQPISRELIIGASPVMLFAHQPQTRPLRRPRECGRKRLAAPQTHLGIVRAYGPDTDPAALQEDGRDQQAGLDGRVPSLAGEFRGTLPPTRRD